jgi:hypothetical protein
MWYKSKVCTVHYDAFPDIIVIGANLPVTRKMPCKEICIRHKAQKRAGVDSGRYASGRKRCQVCDIFIEWDSFWCPCCGYRLRTRPRSLKYRTKLQAQRMLEERPMLVAYSN